MPSQDQGGDQVTTSYQTTIHNSICCAGIGLHGGQTVRMTLRPAPAGSGIMFVRADLAGARVPARFDAVTDTRLGTTLGGESDASVATVEHLMAAAWGCGIDNLEVEIDGPEVPAMDGSSEPFVFLLDCAGRNTVPALRQYIRVLRPVTAENGSGCIMLLPDPVLSMAVEIDFDNPVIGRQSLDAVCDDTLFRSALSGARTFAMADEVAALRAAGLAQGGSLDNAIVVGDGQVLNEGGLRFADEFVRHKMLDCLGDLYLAGAPLLARIEASCTGHTLNNAVLRALFADEANWCLESTPVEPWTEEALAATA
jgi:UDP-3-O-[3-hydroxymyristoyl] N-acetylglucosamine deacetylase